MFWIIGGASLIHSLASATDWKVMAWVSNVLGQIGVAYFNAVLIYLYSNLKWQIIWTVSILLGFWAVMILVPVPGFGAGVLTPTWEAISFATS